MNASDGKNIPSRTNDMRSGNSILPSKMAVNSFVIINSMDYLILLGPFTRALLFSQFLHAPL